MNRLLGRLVVLAAEDAAARFVGGIESKKVVVLARRA